MAVRTSRARAAAASNRAWKDARSMGEVVLMRDETHAAGKSAAGGVDDPKTARAEG